VHPFPALRADLSRLAGEVYLLRFGINRLVSCTSQYSAQRSIMMSGVRAVPGSAEARLPSKSHPTQKRDEEDEPLPRRSRKHKPTDAGIAEPEAHQLDVEA
jgi:hypothetical protein